jgi:hypothetical protein
MPITPPRIGQLSWATWQGDILPPVTEHARQTRYGGTADIIHLTGSLIAQDSQIEVVNWATSTIDATRAYDAAYALAGTTVVCIDAHGRTWPAVLVERIARCHLKAEALARAAQPGSTGNLTRVTHRLEASFVLRAQQGPLT